MKFCSVIDIENRLSFVVDSRVIPQRSQKYLKRVKVIRQRNVQLNTYEACRYVRGKKLRSKTRAN